MLKRFLFFVPVVLLVIHSCSGGRIITSQNQPASEEAKKTGEMLNNDRPVRTGGELLPVDPVKLALDTITLRSQTTDLNHFDSVFLHLTDAELLYHAKKSGRGHDTICIIGTGDIMPGTNYPDERYLPPGNDCAALFDPVREVLHSGDVAVGNLEGVFSAEGGTPKKCKDPSVCYVFRMPDEYLSCILDAGYDVLGVANNHVNDFGPEGRKNTAKLMDEAGIPYAGFLSRPFTIFEKDGITYGFAAFAPHIGTVDLKDYAGAAEIVSYLDSLADIVIVSFHGGAEGKDHQHVPCTDEIYLGYNRGNVCRFAHTVVDAGADVVFGHGPHVIRGMELYKDRLICYSLGNFCTYARFNLSGPNGLAPVVKVFTDPGGAFLEGEIIPFMQTGEGGPRVDPRKLSIIKFRELSKADFPESPLEIELNGRFHAR